MRFFLVALDPGTGTVRLIKEGTYAQRQDALDVLGPAVDEDSSLATSDLFLVDLDQIAPVVLYRPATPTVAPEEPLADAWIAPADEPAADEAVEEAVLEGPEPLWVPDETLTPAEPDDGDLADALRRAASRMESEGIVAPPSVEEFAAQGASEPPAATALTEEALAEGLLVDQEPWPWESTAGEDTGPTAAEDTAVAAVEESAKPEALPAAGMGDQDGAIVELEAALSLDSALPDAVVAPEQSGVFEPVGIDEPGLEEVQLLTPVGDLASHPLIMGEYAPDPGADVDELTLSELEALAASLGSPVSSADAAVEVEVAPVIGTDGVESPADEAQAVEVPAEEATIAEASTAGTDTAETVVVAPVATPSEEKAYEPGGLDIAAYTCDDCVYVETCPKARQEGPATCGSFQWKSV
jgi:hypothetical protein